MEKEIPINFSQPQDFISGRFHTDGSSPLAPVQISQVPEVKSAQIIEIDFVNRTKVEKKNFGGSEAFRLEYDPRTSEKALYSDIVSYLGEYRFQLPEYRFTQFYGKTESDKTVQLRDTDQGESMIEIGENGIEQRSKDGESVDKVTADLNGLKKVESILADAKDGDRIVYASPPDPKYGFKYGFLYDSRVEEIEGGDKRVHVRALRMDNEPKLAQFNDLLSQLSGDEYSYTKPNDFIENPVHITRSLSDMDVNRVLHSTFQFDADSSQQAIFKEVIAEMDPYIRNVITMIKSGESEQGKAFNALENYALTLKKSKEKALVKNETVIFLDAQHNPPDFGNFMKAYGHKPPVVAGSCGSSDKGGRGGNDMFGTKSIFRAMGGGKKEEYTGENAKNDPNLCRCPNGEGAHFHCDGKGGECNQAITVGEGITKCPKADCGKGKSC